MLRLLATCLALVLSVPVGAASTADVGAAETAEWREGRLKKLEDPEGWLSLVGLHWLRPGKFTLGSGDDNDIVLATGPGELGTIEIGDDGIDLCVTADGVTVDDETVECARLVTDTEDEYSKVRASGMLFYVIDRGGQLGLRVKSPESPTLAAFEAMPYFPYAPRWRVDARFEAHEDGRVLELANVVGTTERIDNPGRLVFEIDGQIHSLEAAQYEGDDELFLVFADKTNGKSTYGAGRMLYTPLPDEANRVAVDFNQAYNPPCVFTPYSTCPLPPLENRLRLAIEAGEMNYEDGVYE